MYLVGTLEKDPNVVPDILNDLFIAALYFPEVLLIMTFFSRKISANEGRKRFFYLFNINACLFTLVGGLNLLLLSGI